MKRILIEIGFCATIAVAAIATVFVYKYKTERAEHETEMARQDAKDAEDALQQALSDKRVLEAMMVKYDEAYLAADKQMREAIRDNVKRNQEISGLDSDWRGESLPDGVRDVFAVFVCDGTDESTAGGTPGTVRQADH